MDIITRQHEISIVVIGVFSPMKMSPKWLFERNILSDEEWKALSDEILVSQPASRFKFGDIEFTCLDNRIQVRTSDISKSNRLKRLVFRLFECLDSPKIRAVGINSEWKITFASLKDSMAFARYFSILDSMSDFMGEPRLKKIVFEDFVEANAENPRKTISIQPIGEEVLEIKDKKTEEVKETQKNTIYSLSENNHFVVSDEKELFSVLEKTENFHETFRIKAKKMVENI